VQGGHVGLIHKAHRKLRQRRGEHRVRAAEMSFEKSCGSSPGSGVDGQL
jgi:ribosomal protein L32